ARLGFDIDAQEEPHLSSLNSVIQLLHLSGTQLAENHDGVDPQTGYTASQSDSYLEHTFLHAGVYAVHVRDASAAAGGPDHSYILAIDYTTSPDCTDNDGDGVTTCEGDCDDDDPT